MCLQIKVQVIIQEIKNGVKDNKMEQRIVSIKDFPNYYITNEGFVWSCKRKIWLKLVYKKQGYAVVGLYKNGKMEEKLIHHLVLENFVGSCPSGYECRHLDGNPKNNNFSNLCWGTRSENQKDSVRHGTAVGLKNKGANNHFAKLTEQQVKQIYSFYTSTSYTEKEIAEMFNVTEYAVYAIVNKITWKHIWN
jgi:hypothetical protein